MQVPPDIRLPAVGRCIYCLRTAEQCKLGEEHIIAFSFGGNLILPESSCQSCADVTGAIEGHCSGHMFRALRVHQQVPTRRPKNRPTHLTVIDGTTPHGAPMRDVPVADAPGAVSFPMFEPPGFMIGAPVNPGMQLTGFSVYATTQDAADRQKKLMHAGFSGALAHVDFQPHTFARVLAKIAHGFAAAHAGLNGFRPLLVPAILGKDPNVSHYVGGTIADILPAPAANSLHQIAIDTIPLSGREHLMAQIRLFSHLKPLSPVYTVIVGEMV